MLTSWRLQAIEVYEIKKFTPFNPVDKKTTAVVVHPDGRELVVAKGAPQVSSGATSLPCLDVFHMASKQGLLIRCTGCRDQRSKTGELQRISHCSAIVAARACRTRAICRTHFSARARSSCRNTPP